MNSIRATQKLNERELELVTDPSASWHRDYDDTSFVYIGGLDTRLSEGDVLTIFSQYGEPVFINLVRDKETGKSKGFCFLKYEDQRSCALAVDNLGGCSVLGRVLRVDHTRYKVKEGEEIYDNTTGEVRGAIEDAEESESSSEEEVGRRPMLKEEKELQKLLAEGDEEDPMQAYMIQQKREEVKEAIEKAERRERKEREREKRKDRDRKDKRRRHGSDDESRKEKRRSHRDDDRERRPRHASESEEDRRRRKRDPRRSRSPRRDKSVDMDDRRSRSLSKTPVYGD